MTLIWTFGYLAAGAAGAVIGARWLIGHHRTRSAVSWDDLSAWQRAWNAADVARPYAVGAAFTGFMALIAFGAATNLAAGLLR